MVHHGNNEYFTDLHDSLHQGFFLFHYFFILIHGHDFYFRHIRTHLHISNRVDDDLAYFYYNGLIKVLFVEK